MNNIKMEVVDYEETIEPQNNIEITDEEPFVLSTMDLLDRQEFVDKVINVIEILAEQKKNACFAINGEWGVGKSFVLKMIEEQLSIIQTEKTAGDKYIIFNYNCWQYDYYEEPIVAIVATMLEQIDDKIEIIPAEKREIIIGVLKTVGTYLLKKGAKFVKTATGLPVDTALDFCIDITKEGIQQINDDNEFDSQFKFKKALTAFQKQIASLSEDYTVIFVVDELDRCLPEYSIKVLERLHHLFEGVSNTQVILSIDKTQLENTIEGIFGKSENHCIAKRYLKKFINFEINLSEGSFNEAYERRFAFYFDKFYVKGIDSYDVEELKYKIFQGIDIRSRIEIIERCNLLHDIICSTDEKLDISYMFVEIMLAILFHLNYNFDGKRDSFSLYNVFITGVDKKYEGLFLLNSKINNDKEGLYVSTMSSECVYVRTGDIWGVILAMYRIVIGFKNDAYPHSPRDMSDLINHTKLYFQLIKTIH